MESFISKTSNHAKGKTFGHVPIASKRTVLHIIKKNEKKTKTSYNALENVYLHLFLLS